MSRQFKQRTKPASLQAGAVWPPRNGNSEYLSGVLRRREGQWLNQDWVYRAWEAEFGPLAPGEALVLKQRFSTQDEITEAEREGKNLPEARLWIEVITLVNNEEEIPF